MNISIIGLGLLGGSFALGLKQSGIPVKLTGVDNNTAHAEEALTMQLVEQVMPLEEAVASADVVVLATPVNAILNLLPQLLDILPENAVLMDFGSTKEEICKAVEGHPRRQQFVAMHPIAGTEYSGPSAALPDLLLEKTMIICEKEKSSAHALELAEQLCMALRMHLRYMPAAAHDLHFAYVSHLSHISSFALGLTVLDKEKNEKNIFDMAGSGFSSTVRLAKSSPQMWGPIFSQNRQHVSEALAGYIAQLQQFKDAIDSQDEEKTKALMAKANEIKRILG
ncbi:prephenate dehydrogenase [Pontibacter sp. CAU 1760]